MDISILVPAVQELFEAGITNSTHRVYKSGDKRYNEFCSNFRLTPYPVTETKLWYFVAYLFKGGLSAGTVKSYLAAVRHSQIARGLGNPHISEMPRLTYIVKGLKRKASNTNARPRFPMTSEILRAMKGVWQINSNRNKTSMLWAATCTCFFGFLRSGEVVVPSDSDYNPAVHLSFGDVSMDNATDPQFLKVTIASKTDPFHQGVRVYLGRTNTDLCQWQQCSATWSVGEQIMAPSSGTTEKGLSRGRDLSRMFVRPYKQWGSTRRNTLDIVSV